MSDHPGYVLADAPETGCVGGHGYGGGPRRPVWLRRARQTTVQQRGVKEELIGELTPPGKRGPVPKLQQQMERIQRLPKSQQRFVMQMIDTVLAQQDR